ncbi:MAG: peptidase C11 [Clostridia bacterium]|nr:peptidase C11 [Clostridia bacterium]
MQRTPGGGGRKKRVTGGGGNVFKRGEGINSGSRPSTGSSGGSRDSGTRAGGSSLGIIALVLSLLLGKSNNGGSGNNNRGGCLKRIIILVIIIAIASAVMKCMAGGMSGMSGMLEDYTSQQSSYEDISDLTVVETQPEPTPQPAIAPTQEAPADTTVSNQARDKRTKVLGGGKDVYTIMIYMCGTDLESNYGMATADLNEMLHADIADNVNIIIETGGTKKWQNTVISNKTNQIYQIKNDGIVRLQSDLGKKAMTKASTLTEFIDYCETNFPANRYALIMWDHGGGSASGYGYDEQFPNTGMTLDVFNEALKDAGCVFDFIGFDACLMATLETALVAEQYADYFIASEETEPGCGWYYTNWLTKLSKNTSMDTVAIGKTIIDDFTVACRQQSASNQTTLSIVDLAELAGTIPEAFNDFASSTMELIESDNYAVVSNARSRAKEFSSGINQIDLIHFAENMGTAESKALASALRDCVKYNRVSNSLKNANGISIFFPYNRLSSMSTMVNIYDEIGMDETYTACIRSFASMASGGQLVSSSTGSPLDSLFGSMTGSGNSADMLGSLLSSALSGSYGGSSYSSGAGAYSSGNSYADLLSMLAGSSSGYSWMDQGRMMKSQEYYEENSLDASRLTVTEKDGTNVLKLSDEEWELVQEVELNVYADDGEGFIDLGLDNTYYFDDDLDLVMDYDNTWIAINGQVVSYTMQSHDTDGDTYVITGSVPALLNGERVELILVFSDQDEYGTVAGARKVYDDEETDTVMRGLIDIKDGDVIDFLCDYYSYEGEYLDTYMLGNRMTVDGELFISNVDIGDVSPLVTYRLTDIYGNHFWTEAIQY